MSKSKCSICHEKWYVDPNVKWYKQIPNKTAKLKCGHRVHCSCFTTWDNTCQDASRDTTCPVCREVIYPIYKCSICHKIHANAQTKCGHFVHSDCFEHNLPLQCSLCKQNTGLTISFINKPFISYKYYKFRQ